MSTPPTSSDHQPSARIPVTVVAGYLGAGKTTLINQLLRDNAGQRLAILVNDFGSINVDVDLIESHDGRTLSLTNGCVCCSIAGDLGGALQSVAEMRPKPDRILIEASGVADPERIVNHARGQAAIGVDGIVVLADAETIQARSTDRFVGTTVRRQLAGADLIAVTKADLVARTEQDEVCRHLQRSYPGKAIVSNTLHDIQELILAGVDSEPTTPLVSPNENFGEPADHDTRHVAQTFAFPNPVEHEDVADALTSLGRDVLRCKGWLRFREAPETTVLVQGVGSRLEFQDARPGRATHRPCLVIICRNDGAAPDRIRQVMQSIQASADAKSS